MRMCLAVLAVVLLPTSSWADWPTYRSNAARGGYHPEPLAGQLSAQWECKVVQTPAPAWPRDERMPFDRAPQLVTAGNRVLFGSTIDGKIYGLDSDTGEVAWTFVTGGPVRFAPAIWRDRAFCTSDDGYLYAVRLTDGGLLWKKRGGPDNRMVLGNQRLVSKWPARGGAAIVDDTVYFAAGIWPSDGIFLYAIDADTGATRWVNDSSGGIYMAQPHGGANARSGVSAQGYLVASGDKLFVPTGRAVPAVFDRHTGEFLYFHLQKYGHNGGAQTMAVGELFFNSGIGFSVDSGEKVASNLGGQIAATPDGLIRQVGAKVSGYRWVSGKSFDRRGKEQARPTLEPLWEASDILGGASLIIAGDDVVCGGSDRVTVVSQAQKKSRWSTEVKGVAYGLAVTDGRLYVSTDQGRVYCFGPDKPATGGEVANGEGEGTPYAHNSRLSQLAQQILTEESANTGPREGYCVDLGCGDGELSYHLARLSNLQIYAVEPDPRQAEIARQKLTAAGVYGQVIVHSRPLHATGYPKYFADLIVSAQHFRDPTMALPPSQIQRIQRPCGGVVARLEDGRLVHDERGPLPGAGDWTHQYSTASNTLNSGDSHIKGRLSMLWYRDVSFDIPQRHGRAPAPLYSDGRLFHAGLNGIVAVDAYNGRELWRHEIKGLLDAYDGDELMGAAGTGGNFCIEGDHLYVRDGTHCLQLDVANGKVRNDFPAPTATDGKPGTWGHVAAVGGSLFGSVADPEHVVTYRYVNRGGNMKKLLTESLSLFSIDSKTGDLQWRYDAKDSIRHNAIAIAEGRVFLIDRPQALFDRQKKSTEKPHPTGALVCIDTTTGKELWRNEEDIYGTLLSYSEAHQTVLMSYQPTRFRLDSELGGRMAAFDAKTGQRRWDIQANYQSRPMINDDLVYAQGGAWELLTGKPRAFDFTRSYGCGVLAGSKHMMLFRSATLGYFDLDGKRTTENFGGVRPGCWINAIPAGGIVMVPDASSGCQCSYLNKAWFALDSDTRVEPEFAPGGGPSRTPVKVAITGDPDAQSIRYTLDGSTPDERSPEYTQPLTISETATLKARALYEDGALGPVANGEYQVDETFLPLTGEGWSVWDTPGPQLKEAPSKWQVAGSAIVQSSNIHEGNSGAGKPSDRRDGTLRIYQPPSAPFANGVFHGQIQSTDNDGIGLAFRVQSPNKLYLVAFDAQRKFQVLAVRDDDQYRILDQNDIGYTPNRWHDVRIEAQGNSLTVYFDGKPTLAAKDETIPQGGVALYSWGNSGVSFRALKISERYGRPEK